MGDNRVKYYAGVGARKSPTDILAQMYDIAGDLACKGYTLRSGGAEGADEFFYKGAGALAGSWEIFLPKERFRGFLSKVFGDGSFVTHETSLQAYIMATGLLGESHWNALDSFGKACHARNCHQVLGANLDSPVDFVLCWTPGGATTGGTATAIKLAKKHGIPVINMFNKDWRQQLEMVLK
jgi:hypothetical protein